MIRHLLMLPSICAFGLACVCPAVAQAPQPVFGWQFHTHDMAYLRRAIDRAAEDGVNHVQLSHGIIDDIEDLFEHEGLAADIEELATRAHGHGMKVFVWTHELEAVPDGLKSDGKVNLDGPALWRWLRGKYERAFDLVPSIDGVILTFHETDASVYDDGDVRSSLPRPDRVTKLVDAMHDVCASRGKALFVRTFVYRPDELDWVVRGLQAAPPEVGVMSKEVPHDWQPKYPPSMAIGAFGGREQIVEFDLAHEYYGQCLVPYLYPEYVQERLQYAHARGIRGAVARVDRRERHALGSVGELNLMAFSRLRLDPDADIEQLWRAIVAERYGPRALGLIPLLKRTREIIERTYLTLDFYFLNNHSRVPSLRYAEGHVSSHSVAKWAPSYREREAELNSPTADTYRRVMAEKNEAWRLAVQNLAALERLRDRLRWHDYQALRAEFEREIDLVKLFHALADAYFAYQVHRRHPADVPEALIRQKLDGLTRAAKYCESTGGFVPDPHGDDHWIFDPERIRDLRDDIAERLGG